MTQPEIPPCPDELLHRLREPVNFAEVEDGPPDSGTVWEVCAPDGELLLFLVVQRFLADDAASFPFVRAVPLSDFVRPTQADDAIVAIESSATIFAAHCWLEGPVLSETLVRCLGAASRASMDAVAKARSQTSLTPASEPVASFRESLFEQFDPVFAACWEKLYASLDESHGNSEGIGEGQLPCFVEIRVANHQKNEIGASPHFAQALQEPIDESSTSEAPTRRWEPMRIEADKLQWRKGSAANAQSNVAEINVEWYEAGYLLVLTQGLFRRGENHRLHVRWFDAEGNLRGEAETSRDQARAPLMLKPNDGMAPQLGDRLAVTHLWTPEGGEGWEVATTIQF